MEDQVIAYQDLGEVILDEVLVRAGIDQARSAHGGDISLELDFHISVDAENQQLVIRGERIGQSAFELRLALGEAPAEWHSPRRTSS